MLSKEEQQLRDKLNAYRPPFEAGDWEAMEQMLDAKPRRRMLGWWPLGIAALLVGTGSMLGAGLMINRPAKGLELSSNSRPANTRSFHPKAQAATSGIGTALPAQNIIGASTLNSAATPLVAHHLSNLNNSSNLSNNIYTHSKKTTAPNSVTTAISNNAGQSRAGAIEEMLLTLNMSNTHLSEAKAEMPAITPQKASDDNMVITAIKQKAWHWGIGADFATLVNINSYRVNDVKKLAIRNFLLSDAGLNVQLTFKNKVGIYSGVKYAKRPATLEDSLLLNKMAGHKAKEKAGDYLALNIPIGVYVAMYNDKFVSVYGKAGINNIINLVQESHYQWVTEESAPPANIAKIGNAQLMATTDNTAIDQVSSPGSTVISPKTYHLRKTPDRRYSAELYLAAGASIHVGKSCSVNIEPAYMLNLSSLGKPNHTSHNFGLNAGILYRF